MMTGENAAGPAGLAAPRQEVERMAAMARLFNFGLAGIAGAVALSISVLPASAAKTGGGDAVTDPAALCEHATRHHEIENGLPRALLAAVSLAESGRVDPATRQSRAWPWTINAEGRGYYFKTKEEAVRTTQRLLDSGMRSIDIGCMQVNLRYHPDAFASLEDGFDPMTNVAYGADFLKRLHAQTGNWPKAVAFYHSQTRSHGGRYFARVIRIWESERNRIANAAYVSPVRPEPQIDISGELKPAIGPSREIEVRMTENIATASIVRPAPKVLDAGAGRNVREAAVAAIGLRLSIADGEFEGASDSMRREPPRVLDPVLADIPTRVAEADIPGA